VVENIHRHLEAGQSRLEAAIKGAGEIAFTVVTISISLIAAFIPLLLMAASSDAVPAVCADCGGRHPRVSADLTDAGAHAGLALHEGDDCAVSRRCAATPGLADWLIARYATALDWVLGHQRLVLATFAATVLASIVGYILIPKASFLSRIPARYSVPRWRPRMFPGQHVSETAGGRSTGRGRPCRRALREQDRRGGNGGNSLSQGQLIIMLKDKSQRDVSAEGFINRMRRSLQAFLE